MSDPVDDQIEEVMRDRARNVPFRLASLRELHEAEMRLRHDIYAPPRPLTLVKTSVPPSAEATPSVATPRSLKTRFRNWLNRK